MDIICQQGRGQRIAAAPLIGAAIKGKAYRRMAINGYRLVAIAVCSDICLSCHPRTYLFDVDVLRVFCGIFLAAASAGLWRRQLAS